MSGLLNRGKGKAREGTNTMHLVTINYFIIVNVILELIKLRATPFISNKE